MDSWLVTMLSPRTAFLLLCGLFILGTPTRADVIILKNGMELEGRLGKISALGESPIASTGDGGRISNALIVLVDDDLRRTFVCTYQVQDRRTEAPEAMERIMIQQRVATRGQRVVGVGPIIKIDPFDEWGRRTFSMNTLRGRLDVIQGITEITPKWTKVEGLLGNAAYVWDMRISTQAIPRETLSAILKNQINPKNANERLSIVRLYLQSGRYQDAQTELQQCIDDFPELNALKNMVRELRQESHQRMLEEIEARKAVGQHHLAFGKLHDFLKEESVAGTRMLTARDLIAEYEKAEKQATSVLEYLELHLALIDDGELREQVAPIRDEIAKNLNINNLDRFADYLRLAENETLKADNKISLAISGWLLGSDAGTENLAVSLSLFDVRNLVRQYLQSKRVHERQEHLKKIEAQEGGSPRYVAQLLANMKPHKEVQSPATDGEEAERVETDVRGMYRLTTKGLTGGADIVYHVQLPPEYDPHRRYPTIVTLNGAGTSPLHQIDWWAGPYHEKFQMRLGQAARRGYIVIAPHWQGDHQYKYGYSAQEHAAILYSLRDACRRFSVDTDRVFLSGHSIGGDAAWDIGLSHPDLWAGVIPIVPVADKYVSRYWENGKLVPMYFVTGELDGDKLQRNKQDLNRYLTRSGFDVIVSEYLGRGHENFSDEIQRLFTWMGYHKRDFHPEEFECVTMRPWDNFFWWVELDGMPGRSMCYPAGWPPPAGLRPVTLEARVSANNRLRIATGASRATVWLSPEMVDFAQRVTISANTRSENLVVKPSVETILEDVRTRGDRQHPFWAKVEVETGRGR
jgi:predicted esterase